MLVAHRNSHDKDAVAEQPSSSSWRAGSRRSRAVSLASEESVQSSAEPPHMTIITAMRENAAMPMPWATTWAASVTFSRSERRVVEAFAR